MSFLNDRENHPMKPAEPRIFFMGWSMTNSIYVTVIGLFIFLFLLVSMLGRYFSRNFPLASLSLYLAHVVTLSGHLRLITLNVLRFYVSVKSRFTFHFLKCNFYSHLRTFFSLQKRSTDWLPPWFSCMGDGLGIKPATFPIQDYTPTN